MPVIRLLSESLRNQIAAGEVVERPSSIVKELVENAFDAGAHHIVLKMHDGGIRQLQIIDDGHGMDKEDIALSCVHSATSKLVDEVGLWHLSTYGFRGEALASIAAVSHLVLESGQSFEAPSASICYEFGDHVGGIGVCAPRRGTMVTVSDLFARLPARRKFLSSPKREAQLVTEMVWALSLSRPDVSFEVWSDDSLVYQSPATDRVSRYASLFGKNFVWGPQCEQISWSHDLISADLITFPPLASSSRRRFEYCFVNGRLIQSAFLKKVIGDALKKGLMHETPFLPYCLFLQLPEEYVDVNVHPRKLEVRFYDQKQIVHAIATLFSTHFEKYKSRHALPALDSQSIDLSTSSPSSSVSRISFNHTLRTGGGYEQKDIAFITEMDMKDTLSHGSFKGHYKEDIGVSPQRHGLFERSGFDNKLLSHPIGTVQSPFIQLGDGYLVRSLGRDLEIIDQHALYERWYYDRLSSQKKLTTEPRQAILFHETFSLDGCADPNGLLPLFDALGITALIQDDMLRLTESVSFFRAQDRAKIVQELLLESENTDVAHALWDAKIARLACRLSLKFGSIVSGPLFDFLLAQEEENTEKTCPHGRPYKLFLTRDSLDAFFRRLSSDAQNLDVLEDLDIVSS